MCKKINMDSPRCSKRRKCSTTHMAEIIRVMNCMPCLEFHHDDLNGDNMTVLARELTTNTMVRELDLSYNDICSTDLEILFPALETNTTLERLDLSINFIGRGADSLMISLRKNTTLHTLNLTNNLISGYGLSCLLRLTNQCPTFKRLYLGYNMINDLFDINDISKDIANNTTLTSLYIPSAKLGDREINIICNGLKLNTTLKYLDFSHNPFSYSGIESFAEVLVVNKTITSLDIQKANKNIMIPYIPLFTDILT